jgi:putative endopeptidase
MRSNSSRLLILAVLVTAISIPLLAADPATHALDVAGMDRSVDPGDDFYRYANGGWIQATEIPADRANIGVFAQMAEEAGRRTRGLIQEAEKSKDAPADARKIGAYYAAFVDEKTIERKGMTPLAAQLRRIRDIKSKSALASELGRELRADVDPLNTAIFHTDRLFGLWVSRDFNNPDRNVAFLLQGGLSMPDRDYYLGTDAKSVELQAKYRAHIAAVLKLAKVAHADAQAARIYDLERKIAGAHVSRTDSEDVLKANNPWRLADFSKKAPGLAWSLYFEGAELAGQKTIVVWQPSAVTGIAALVEKEPLSVWKEYLAFRTIDRSSAVLPKAFRDERFNFYGTVLTGAPKQRERWKVAIDATNEALGEAVGRLYAEHYFPPAAKTAAQEMVKNIVAAFGKRIDRLEWMSPATREKAKAKLGTLYIGIGYPDTWRDYSGLRIVRDDAFGNGERSGLFDYRASLAKLGKPVDRTEWAMTPQTVNAVNLPVMNSLNFPAAILAPPFFDAAAEPVLNYGAIGTVIGHEISHSFDDQGSQFDAEGRLLDWWTPADLAHFREAADRLAAQFNTYEPLPGLHVNGRLTLGENIADVAGLAAAYDGYHAAYGGKAADAQGFTGDQRFFLAFAQNWRTKTRPEALRNSLMTNGHAPGEYRADTVRNIDEWYETFNIQPGKKLYLTPEQRVEPW